MIFAITGYQWYYRVRGIFPNRKTAKNYLEKILTNEERKYLTVLTVNKRELVSLQKKGNIVHS